MLKLALLWHMHQPYYEDLATGEHILPWVRLHALKDYWGMVALLEEFPTVRATFNLVPSLVAQVEAFAAGRAYDRHLIIGLKEAGTLEPDERDFLVANGFHAQFERMIRPFPRYLELHDKRLRREPFAVNDLRDLQVLHKLVWVDVDWGARDSRIQALTAKGRGYTEQDKALLHDVERALLNAVIPAYRQAAASGRVELSTSPFYHPILPLLCDTDSHFRAHPESALPRGLFARPEDARAQLTRAFEYHQRLFGTPARGVWPSEGSLSDEVIGLLADHRCEWTATDEDLLARSLGHPVGRDDVYRPWVVGAGSRTVRTLFRDHGLSDLIGFTYQSWDADAAAADFVRRVREGARGFGAREGETATISVILDGENAWEHYAGGGRPFLRALYGKLADAHDIATVTMAEAAAAAARPLTSVFPGSWINSDFYIWAGHRDDHRAWTQLAAARRAFDEAAPSAHPAARERAYDELLIAEGSDWFWWYGDDHSSEHDRDFDDLFRRHLRNVYGALGLQPPDALHLSNITTETISRGPVDFEVLATPDLDAPAGDFAAWAAAAVVPVTEVGSGTMHRITGLVSSIRIAADRQTLYFRFGGSGLAERLTAGSAELVLIVDRPPRRIPLTCHSSPATGASQRISVAAMPVADLHAQAGDVVGLALLVVDGDGHVLEQHPSHGVLEVRVPDRHVHATRWAV